MKGTLYIPYAELNEPFEAWFDGVTNRSRIDYYGGMVKTYQLRHTGPYGTSLKIAPVTTDEVPNKITCLQVNGTTDNTIDPQAILPDVRSFEWTGKTIKHVQTFIMFTKINKTSFEMAMQVLKTFLDGDATDSNSKI